MLNSGGFFCSNLFKSFTEKDSEVLNKQKGNPGEKSMAEVVGMEKSWQSQEVFRIRGSTGDGMGATAGGRTPGFFSKQQKKKTIWLGTTGVNCVVKLTSNFDPFPRIPC